MGWLVFPPQVWGDYEAVTQGRADWQDILAGWEVDLIVVAARDTDFRQRLLDVGWEETFSDFDGSVLRRP